MQTGRIERKGQSWILRYGVKVLGPDGQVVWAKRAKKLAPVCDDYRSEASVRHLAAEILAPLNAKTAKPEITDTVQHFFENTYLPYCKSVHKPSTYNGYKFLLEQLKPHLGAYRVRDFGTVEAEKLLNDYAQAKNRAHNTLKNVRGFLSGGLRYAVRVGVIKFNPIRETVLPRNGKPMANTRAYTLTEIKAMLKVLGEPARTVVTVAAYTGLRLGEIRGLRWEDFKGEVIEVKRSVWRKHVGNTKTVSSAGTIPVIPVLGKALNEHRAKSPAGQQYLFESGTKQPLVIANLTRRSIVPKLKEANVPWEGWHGFRRGLATTLYELKVPDKVIQQILRHASVEVTRKHYIKTSTEQAEAAMKKLAHVTRERATRK
jgi:integrase